MLLLPTTIIPIVVGVAALAGSRAGLYSPEVAVILVVVVLAMLLGGLAIRATAAAETTDRELQRAADEARRSEERQQIVMQTVTDAIITIGLDSRIRYANPASGRMFGYADGELIGTLLTTLMPERFRDRHLAGIHRYAENGVRAIDWQGTELVGLRRSGEEFPIDVAFAEAGAGADRTYTGSIRDISVRKRLETQLLQAQRLESVGRLAGGIAHDFNNVLTAILGFARLMIDELPPGDRQREKVGEIEDAANRASGLVRQLLAFGRQQVLRPEVVDLGEVVRGVSPMLERLIGANVAITVPPAGRGLFVEADQGQLEQVVVNLAINARDAMPKGGRLVFEVAGVDLDAEYVAAHPEAATGPHVVLTVSDTGTGMDAETQAHIFEPFFTTKDSGQGTGLGLATVYGIVLQSGGHIWVSTEIDTGTTFRISFPRATRAPEARPAALPAPASATGKETILVAEDEESLRSLVKVVLTRLGYRVLLAANASAALEIASTEPFDLLVTDVVMPGRSGLELADAMREIVPHARVLYMSGYSEAALEGHGGIGGDDALIEKPFTPAALGIAVRQALDRQA